MTRLSPKQRMCLADAYSARHINGLQKYGRWWKVDKPYSQSHDNKTVKSLVGRGYLSLWDKHTCAQVTEDGSDLHESLIDRPSCRKCGCTEHNACVKNGTPCHWVEPDLCSACK